ncbi:uncharacterized protein [Panulirus ornatus]|uniref:uncharacterized protein isoform X1 n=1 Tax=Panulirus ornatus TaxID=150431 RepID=UPI003A8473E6
MGSVLSVEETMLLITSLTLLLLLGVVQPAPRSPYVFEEKEDGRKFQQPSAPATDAWIPHEGIMEEEDPVGGSVLRKEDDEDEVFPMTFDRRHVGRMNFDQIIRRLFDHMPRTYHPRPVHDLYPHQGWTLFDIIPSHPVGEGTSGHDDQGVGGSPVFEDYDDYIFGLDEPRFPLPVMPKFPVWHDLPSADDYPDNYDNSTHEVHVVNGTRIEVNNTINKESGDGFNSFFHHKVIHIRPDQDAVTQTPVSAVDYETTIIPQEEEDLGVDMEGEVDKEEEPPSYIPEVENEVSSSGTVPLPIPEWNEVVPAELVEAGEDLNDGGKRRPPRQAGGPSHHSQDADDNSTPSARPKKAAYIYNHIDDDIEVQVGEGVHNEQHPPPPDLSSDTRVNHVNNESQGMVRVDPDAEIFDLNLVLEEARPKDDDK